MDRFDEMARHLEEDDGLAGAYVTRMCRAQPIGQPITEEQVSAWWEEGRRASRRSRIAAALRETDAKARREGRIEGAQAVYEALGIGDIKDEPSHPEPEAGMGAQWTAEDDAVLDANLEAWARENGRFVEPEAGGEACGAGRCPHCGWVDRHKVIGGQPIRVGCPDRCPENPACQGGDDA